MYKQKDQQNKIVKDLKLQDYIKNKNIAYFLNSSQSIQQNQTPAQTYLQCFEKRPQTYLLKTFTKKVALIICYLCLIFQPNFNQEIFKGKDVTNLRNIAKKHFGWRFQQLNQRNHVVQDSKNIIQLLQINIDIITSHIQMITRVFSDVSSQKLIESIKKIKNQHFSIKIVSKNNPVLPSFNKKQQEQSQTIIFELNDKTNQNSFQRVGVFKQKQNSYILFGIFSKEKPRPKPKLKAKIKVKEQPQAKPNFKFNEQPKIQNPINKQKQNNIEDLIIKDKKQQQEQKQQKKCIIPYNYKIMIIMLILVLVFFQHEIITIMYPKKDYYLNL